MNYMKIKIGAFIILLSLVINSCDIDTLNENPNQPETAEMRNLLPKIIKDLGNLMVDKSFIFGNNAAQLTSKSLRVEVDVYNWSGFDVWTPLFGILRDIEELERLAKVNQHQSYEAVADILRVYSYSILTDMYGDIPYSAAVKGSTEGILQPKYDTQDSIYLGQGGFLHELKVANKLLLAPTNYIEGDILFSGDLEKWRRFGNSLCLRLLIRISNKVNVAPYVAPLLSDLKDVMSSNDDNAVFTYLGTYPNVNPITELKAGDFDDVHISENLVKALDSINDPRLGVFARPIDSTIHFPLDSALYEGWINGAASCDTRGSRLGLIYYDYPNHPIKPYKADAIFMTYSEVEFLIAEAIFRGFITGNVAVHYKAAIKSSMSYYKVQYSVWKWADFNAYYNQPEVIYNGDLNRIWKQKWIALFFSGLEPYLEVRRWLNYHNEDWTRLDFLTPTCQNLNNNILPVRFIYPAEEKVLNKDNYDEAVNRLGGDTQNDKIWQLQ